MDIVPLVKIETVFTKIKDLSDTRAYNTICTVEAVYPWVQSKGEDLVLTLKVSDDSCSDTIFIKVFRREETFLHGFNKGDIVKVMRFRYFKVGFYLLDKEGTIEVISSVTNKNDSFKNEQNLLIHPIRQIKDLQYPEYIKFTGKLIYKQKESNNIVILAFVDYTINPHIKKSENTAFYPPNMVLYVRAWDSMAEKALFLEENSFYCLENLKVKIEITKLAADLSENVLSKITKISDQTVINEIQSRSTIPKDKVVTFSEYLYTESKLVKINEINKSGYHKLHVRIIRHHPLNGQYINVCTLCKIAQEESVFRCECGSKPERFLLVKYLVKDESGECVVICKDSVAQNMLSRIVVDQYIELLVHCDYKFGKLYIEVRDVPNFV